MPIHRTSYFSSVTPRRYVDFCNERYGWRPLETTEQAVMKDVRTAVSYIEEDVDVQERRLKKHAPVHLFMASSNLPR